MSDLNKPCVDAEFIILPTCGIFINTITVFCQITVNAVSEGLLIPNIYLDLSMAMSRF